MKDFKDFIEEINEELIELYGEQTNEVYDWYKPIVYQDVFSSGEIATFYGQEVFDAESFDICREAVLYSEALDIIEPMIQQLENLRAICKRRLDIAQEKQIEDKEI